MIFKKLKNFFSKFSGGKTALMIAVESKGLNVIETILRRCNSQVELFRTDHQGRTVLFYAAARGDCDIIWALMGRLAGTGIACARGSLLNKRDTHGKLAEDLAEANGHEDARQLLVHERVRIEYYE